MVYLLLAAGFEETEALVPLDILRRAGVTVKTVAITANPVTGAHGITVMADISAEEATEPIDMLILPGGMPGTKNLDASPHVDRLLDRVLKDGGHIGAICAAPMVLGKRGILSGKRAVCYPGFEDHLEGADIPHGIRCITDRNVTTAIGMGAAYLFGIELASILAAPNAVEEVAEAAMIEC